MRRIVLCPIVLLMAPFIVAQNSTTLLSAGSQEKMCGLRTYHDSLDLAFNHAAAGNGETLVTVQILPSFQREYAVVLKRVGSQVKLLRATFRDQLWTQLGPPMHVPKTRQQCLEQAKAAKVETIEVPATSGQTNDLWTVFSKTNLDTDTCPRRESQCAYFQDGTSYVIQTNEGREIRLTEIGNLKGIKSENAALLDWVHALLQIAKQSQPQ